MFRKRKQAADTQPAQAPQPQQRQVSSGGYMRTELPTFHGRQRKVVVYTSDAGGKIIKTFKRK